MLIDHLLQKHVAYSVPECHFNVKISHLHVLIVEYVVVIPTRCDELLVFDIHFLITQCIKCIS